MNAIPALSPAQLAALDSTSILGFLPERTAVRTREALVRRGLLTPVPRRGVTHYRLTDAGYDARSAIPVRTDTAAAVSGALAAGVAATVAVGMLP